MKDWEEKLSPLMREKLAKIGERTPEEKERMRDQEKIKFILAEFYKGQLDPDGLWQKLKEEGKPTLLKEAQLNLIGSLSLGSSPVEFQKRRNGILAIETLKEDQNTSVLELNLNSIEGLQKRAEEERNQAYNNFKAQVERNPQLRVRQQQVRTQQGQQMTMISELSVDGAIKQLPQWQQFQAEHNKKYSQEFTKTIERLKMEVR